MTSVCTSSLAISMEMSQLIDAEWSYRKGSSCRQMPSQSWSTEQSRRLLAPAACSQSVLAAGQPWQDCWIVPGWRKSSRPYCHPWGNWRLGRDGAEAETEVCTVCGLHRFDARWSLCMVEFTNIFIYVKMHLDIYLLNKYSLNTQRPFSLLKSEGLFYNADSIILLFPKSSQEGLCCSQSNFHVSSKTCEAQRM